MTWLVVLDNEAVQALRAGRHPKHRRVLALIEVAAARKRRAVPIELVVPTSVRAEAGWDRTDPTWALPNRLGVRDAALDGPQADAAARIRRTHGVSVPDAHIGAIVEAAPEARVAVITSDPKDIGAVAGRAAVVLI